MRLPVRESAVPVMTLPAFGRRLLAEGISTALLVTTVVGSEIAAQQLSPEDAGLPLLENSTATVLGLAVLILMFGPISRAHLNPVARRSASRRTTASRPAIWSAR